MVHICKIIRTILWGMILSHPFGCIGQNVYNSRTIYYNMDTMQCVDKDARFWGGDSLNIHAGNPDSTGLYCVLADNIEVPLVTVNDDNIIHLLDSCLIDATKDIFLQFPDSSGYFVELEIINVVEDSLKLKIAITLHPNYYMAEILSRDLNEIVYELKGFKLWELHGCFFRNDILCVIVTRGGMDYKRASCLFSQTESTIMLAIYSPFIWLVTDEYPVHGSYDYYFKDCGYNY